MNDTCLVHACVAGALVLAGAGCPAATDPMLPVADATGDLSGVTAGDAGAPVTSTGGTAGTGSSTATAGGTAGPSTTGGPSDPTGGGDADGMGTTGSSGSGGTSTGDPTGTPSLPASPGCSGGTGEAGEFVADLAGGPADYAVRLPPGYDPTVPTPLVFGFHGRNRTHTQFETIDAGEIQPAIADRAIMVYPKSQAGTGWNAAQEVEPNVAFFETLYARMLDEYCVDTSHIFSIGHSSGGYFSFILACRFGDRLRGIGTVAGANQEQNCTGQVAAMIIHGTTDTVVSFASGQQAREDYLVTNGCSQTTVDGSTAPCVAYQGCDADFPVQWCEHTEPTYTDEETGQTTNHGWPSFASRAIGEFLFSLP